MLLFVARNPARGRRHDRGHISTTWEICGESRQTVPIPRREEQEVYSSPGSIFAGIAIAEIKDTCPNRRALVRDPQFESSVRPEAGDNPVWQVYIGVHAVQGEFAASKGRYSGGRIIHNCPVCSANGVADRGSPCFIETITVRERNGGCQDRECHGITRLFHH